MALCASKPQKPARMDCESSEQFGSREHNELSRRITKSTPKCALHKVQAIDRTAHDLAEPLDLAFRLKVNEDPRVVRAPFFQAGDELRAFRLGEHEIAGAKLADLAILKRAAEVF